MSAFSASSTTANFDGAVDGHEQGELAFGGPDPGQIDMEEADRADVELLKAALHSLSEQALDSEHGRTGLKEILLGAAQLYRALRSAERL